LRDTRVLLTFDDGCRDNYDLAFPILRSHGVQGVFFLPTAFIGTDAIAWWDEIANLIQRATTVLFERPIRTQVPAMLSPSSAALRSRN
jgi:peptidoglycan/xylan/chitin deacetylase (PgdA/CDA1 family)